MRTTWSGIALSLITMVTPGAGAHAEQYQGADCVPGLDGFICPAAATPAAGVNYCVNVYPTHVCADAGISPITAGGVTFPGGHIVANSAGTATITITDQVNSPTSGFVCQDTNFDGFCGGSGELAQSFCGAVTLRDTQHGGQWRRDSPISVLPSGPARGAVDYVFHVFCGSLSTATIGTISHS